MSVEITVEQLVELLQAPLAQQIAASTAAVSQLSGRVDQGQRDIIRRVELLETESREQQIQRKHKTGTWSWWWRVAGAIGYIGSLAALWVAALSQSSGHH